MSTTASSREDVLARAAKLTCADTIDVEDLCRVLAANHATEMFAGEVFDVIARNTVPVVDGETNATKTERAREARKLGKTLKQIKDDVKRSSKSAANLGVEIGSIRFVPNAYGADNHAFVVTHMKGSAEHLIPDEKTYPVSFRVTGRLVNRGTRYLAEENGGHVILTATEITKQLREAGASHSAIEEILNWLVTCEDIPRIPPVEAYGLDQRSLDQFYLPPEYLSTGATGYGIQFAADFRRCTDDDANMQAVVAYRQIVAAAMQGIGRTNTLVLVGFAFASQGRNCFLDLQDLFALLHLLGEHNTGKTTAAKHLCNLGRLPAEKFLINAESAESASVLCGCLSGAYSPLGIEEAGANPKTFAETVSILLQLTTSRTARLRNTRDGDPRESPLASRAPMLLSNRPVDAFANPEASERVIQIQFDPLGNNRDAWKAATRAERACTGNVLSYLADHVSEWDLPHLLDDANALADDRAIGDDNERTHKRVIPIFWGLLFAQAALSTDDLDFDLTPADWDDVYAACSDEQSKHVSMSDQVMHALVEMCDRYTAWRDYRAQRDVVAKEANDNPDNTLFLHELADCDRQMQELHQKGLVACVAGLPQIIVTNVAVSKIHDQIRNTTVELKDISHLKTYLESAGFTCGENKTRYIPYDRKSEKSITVTVPELPASNYAVPETYDTVQSILGDDGDENTESFPVDL